MTTRLLPALKTHRLYAAFLVFFTTGLRRGEVAGLRWQDIDGQAAVLHIRQALVRTKNHAIGRTELVAQEPKTAYSRRTIPLLDICQAALRHHRAQQAEEKLRLGQATQTRAWCFGANGAPIDPGTLDRAFAWRSNGLEYLPFACTMRAIPSRHGCWSKACRPRWCRLC